MKQKHKIAKKEFLRAIESSKSAWELIGRLQSMLGYSRDEDIDKATNDLIWREVNR